MQIKKAWHGTYINALVEYIMSGDSFLDVDKEFEVFSKELDKIKISDLNKRNGRNI